MQKVILYCNDQMDNHENYVMIILLKHYPSLFWRKSNIRVFADLSRGCATVSSPLEESRVKRPWEARAWAWWRVK